MVMFFLVLPDRYIINQLEIGGCASQNGTYRIPKSYIYPYDLNLKFLLLLSFPFSLTSLFSHFSPAIPFNRGIQRLFMIVPPPRFQPDSFTYKQCLRNYPLQVYEERELLLIKGEASKRYQLKRRSDNMLGFERGPCIYQAVHVTLRRWIYSRDVSYDSDGRPETETLDCYLTQG